jgi:four helix bundle protein
MAHFKELIVWQKAVDLAVETYAVTSQFPSSEMYGLAGQMRRAAVSIASNIAEGRKRKTTKDFMQFLHMADGSAAELETQVIISKKVHQNISYEALESRLAEVQRMLGGMMRGLRASATKS